jgi:hypothetical protein
LELIDSSSTGYEEWRSYATAIPAGEERSLQLRWFWQYDIAAGEEFRARLRLSEDEVASLDLTNPLVELNFTVSGTAAEFEMFETTIVLPNGTRSFDLTFISGGALAAMGTIYIDDISASIITAPVLPGDYNSDGVVDAADYVVWRKNDGTQAGYETWRTHFGATTVAAVSSAQSPPVPEPTAAILFCVGSAAAWMVFRRGLMR